jgi:hypothetical protein
VDDLKSLLKEISVKGDSHFSKKADDLRSQFDWRKHRMMKYLGNVVPNCLFPPPPPELFVANVVDSRNTIVVSEPAALDTTPPALPFSIDHLLTIDDKPTMINIDEPTMIIDVPTTNNSIDAPTNSYDGEAYPPDGSGNSCFSGTCTE